jgi:hypothetical protein
MGTGKSTAGVVGGSHAVGLPHDVVFSVLSNRRRRFVIHYLKWADEVATVRELSRQVAAWENDVSVAELDYRQRKRVYTSLHQTHLPKLDAVGVVEYDADRSTVALAAGAAALDVYLEVVRDEEIPWSVYYLGLGLLTTLLGGLVWAGIAPFSALPPAAYVVCVGLGLAVSAAVHSVRSAAGRLGGPRPRLGPADGGGDEPPPPPEPLGRDEPPGRWRPDGE